MHTVDIEGDGWSGQERAPKEDKHKVLQELEIEVGALTKLLNLRLSIGSFRRVISKVGGENGILRQRTVLSNSSRLSIINSGLHLGFRQFHPFVDLTIGWPVAKIIPRIRVEHLEDFVDDVLCSK